MSKTRRDFIKNTAMASGALSLFKLADALPLLSYEGKAEIEIYNTNWGFNGDMLEFCRLSKENAYDGIEVWTPRDKKDRENLLAIVKDFDLKLGLLAGNGGPTFDSNLSSFKEAISLASSCQPAFINCHSGKDYYSLEQNSQFIQHGLELESETGIPIYHETHRGRMLFCTPFAKMFMEKFEDLHLTLDISHWTVVHESLLADQKEIVDLALERTRHIHSRVGFQEAPQIPNPQSAHHAQAVEAHFAWWDKVVKLHSERNQKLTMTTEFGPPPYMWTDTETGEAVEKVWDMNVMMMKMWKKRYA